MGTMARVKKELNALPIMQEGYSRQMANAWRSATESDLKNHANDYDAGVLAHWHTQGYLSKSVERYGLIEHPDTDYISDFAYMYLKPFNNSMKKWLDDIITTRRVLLGFNDHLRNVYFSIIRREGAPLILRTDNEDRPYTESDIIDLVKEKGTLELRPAHWASTRSRYVLTIQDGYLHVDGEVTGNKAFHRLISRLRANYVITDRVPTDFVLSEHITVEHYIKLWLANDNADTPCILCATINFYGTTEENESIKETCILDLDAGTYSFRGEQHVVPRWQALRQEILAISSAIPQVSFYTMSIALQNDRPFQILHFSTSPILPEVAYGPELNTYLKKRFDSKFHKRTLPDRVDGFKALAFEKWVGKHCRKGIRPYMERLWLEAVHNDFRHTKGVPLSKKVWAWKRGFLSFRTYQYGLTEENYKGFLSDYDYFWLNRINNDYQKWVNDKTTYRYIMEPFKEHIPSYYFSCYKQNGHTKIAKMLDCPSETPDGFAGVITLLKQKKKLAFKASAGTHGDGFYCLSYDGNTFAINGNPSSEDDLAQLIERIQSFYVITEYIDNMHPFLKNIYPKSVNTVRVMVVNQHGYDPMILQTYMRIGSEKTGYTDNVGYGGVCAMINRESGELYQPEQLSDHRYIACPNHPDTGTPIAGQLPHWDLVRSRILDICRYLCELEYLGFDVAITDDGFRILEINIHQDLHKVAAFTDEMNEFFQRKILDKRRVYGIKN